MKKILIISPYFPPVNAADMQRVRMSLPYFSKFGWDTEVVAVDENYSDLLKDELLLQSVPVEIKVHKVKALNKKWTSKLGLGSLALRSLPYFLKKVNLLLNTNKFHLIYFSTTQFPVCILGAYWKRKFKIPYVIDMQDPWHSNYYLDKPKGQRPKKYWFSYRLNKYLEPRAIKYVDGLIAVSENYISDLKDRYPKIRNVPSATITFGVFETDFEIAAVNKSKFDALLLPEFINIVYIGRGGIDMHRAITPVFEALKKKKASQPQVVNKLKFYFIGTSYAVNGKGTPTILPLAKHYGVDDNVIEITDRISYYHTLATLQMADALFIPGSDDPKYTASKVYPYLLTRRPLLAIFNSQSSALNIMGEYGVKHFYSFDKTIDLECQIDNFLNEIINGNLVQSAYNNEAIKKYSAEIMTKRQCDLFDQIITKT